MKPAFVGFHVGLPVGFLGLPDMHRASGMNNLDPNCRECRVSTGEESARGLHKSAFRVRGIPQTLHLLGLA